jgi:hypothetical protein
MGSVRPQSDFLNIHIIPIAMGNFCCASLLPRIVSDDPCDVDSLKDGNPWVLDFVVFLDPIEELMKKFLFIYTSDNRMFCYDTISLQIFLFDNETRRRMGVWREASVPDKKWFDYRLNVYANIKTLALPVRTNLIFLKLKKWLEMRNDRESATFEASKTDIFDKHIKMILRDKNRIILNLS